ncbi:roadblock/LC7 domain-containing protein [Actinomadura macrotermitis]|uniref:Roadblock/LAMTOR2 domain-containing protein n=1 Tax=Actinomadura macrotermitis TaxID=2585200 RepID=A0A7K0C5W8_9ACTN|nr:hypothetical protein [Actinomadura macrotermitis]MQY08835.1 hypothetical protein [Actinomadura macrotermitis]
MLGIDGCLNRIMEIPGARSVTLVDGASGLAVAAAGHRDRLDQHEDAAATTEAVRSVLACPAFGTGRAGDDITEIIVRGTRGFHLLTLFGQTFDGQLFLHLSVDHDKGNLALARIHVQRLIEEMGVTGDER